MLGNEGNVDYINAKMLQEFMMDNITPKKTLIVANNVKNHDEFVSLVKERVHEILPLPEEYYNRRTPTVYIGGETRMWTETPNT